MQFGDKENGAPFSATTRPTYTKPGSYALSTKVGHGPGHIVLREDLASPQGAQPPIFAPCLVVAKRSPISATAEDWFVTTIIFVYIIV